MTPTASSDFVALGRTKQGRLFRKHILTEGDLIHPVTKEKIPINGAFMDTMVKNFNDGICDIVQIPLANNENEHVEDPERNVGEIIGLEHDGDKLYALADIRKPTAMDAVGSTLLGASAFLHTDYTDTKTDQKVGPTLLHMAITNRPYVTGLEDFKELVAATADSTGETVMLTASPVEEPSKPMTKDELIAELKASHGVDVEALQLTAAMPPAPVVTPPASTTPVLDQATVLALAAAGVLKVDAETPAEEITAEDMQNAIAELAGKSLELTAQNQALNEGMQTIAQERAAMEVDALIREGRVMPAQKDTYVELSMTNRDMFTKLVPDTPLIKLANEQGTSAPEEPEAPADVEAEILRLTGEGSAADIGGYIRPNATKGPRRRRTASASA